MFYEVHFSATVDYINWNCPKCNTYNETKSIFDTCCKNCGYDIENDIYIPSVLDTTISGCYEEKEEED